ncbi:MAG: hybrid sensor histidine kinase/response regulator [Inquilinaceae bacterium]
MAWVANRDFETEASVASEDDIAVQIVIVDDRVTNRNILAKLSSSLEPNAKVHTFADATLALAWMENRDVDLVITDYKMPLLNGAEFTHHCLTKLPGFDAPIIVVTAYEDKDFRYHALEAGATDFLLSPIDHREFRTRVRNLLSMRRQKQIIKGRAVSLKQALDSAQREHAERIRVSEEKLRLVIDSTPNFIYTTDADGRVTLANKALADAFGVSVKAVVGNPLGTHASDPAFAEKSLAEDNRALELQKALPVAEQAMTTAADEHIHLQMVKMPIMVSADARWEVLTVATDITKRKRAELELLRAKDTAEMSNRSKTEFLANMSHELRTPLNAMIGFADLMVGQVFGPLGAPRYHEYAKDIKDSAEYLLQIINDILEVSEIEAGKLRLHERTIDVGKAIDEAIRLVQHRARESSVAIRLNVQPDLPALNADESKLKQVLVNLLTNGVKYTPASGHIDVTADTAADGGICVVIADTGIGMTEEEVTIALTRFGRIESSMVRKHAGTGLGLPLSADLIKAHGGVLEIESAVGEGTTIHIRFPSGRSVQPT